VGRPKKAGMVLASLEECSRAMGDLVVAQTQLEGLVAERDQEVARIQTRFEKSIDTAKTQAGALKQALEDYYYAHIPEIEKDGRKSIDLANGRMGRRMHPEALKPLNRSWTWARILDLMKVQFGNRFLRVKEELDRDLIKAELAAEELKQLGLKLEADETFYVEPARLPEVVG
jgi:phage host-nuclease inhibitor protein Gam